MEHVQLDNKFITEVLCEELCIEGASPVYLNYFLLWKFDNYNHV